MSSIQRLSSDIVKRLRSDVVIGSVAQCILELVQNSIDASATVVEVLVDIQAASLQVVDNGQGIDPDGFELLGQRYGMTTRRLVLLQLSILSSSQHFCCRTK